jgi:site-specific recombinase XerD
MVARALPEADGLSLEALWTAYRRSLTARRRAPGTIERYEYSIRLWNGYLQAHGLPTAPTEWQRSHVEGWVSSLIATKSPATAAGHYRCLRTYCNWLVEEEELDASPMRRMRAPNVPMVPPAVVDADTLGRLLEACRGRGFDERRDTALLLLLASTGIRRGEAVGLHVGDVDIIGGTANVDGKSGRRTVPLTAAVCAAIDRYTRVRTSHRRAGSQMLWLGRRGALSGNGCLQMVQRRARQAGVQQHVWPHLFRHSFAHNALSAGMSELDTATILGHASTAQLQRYGASMRTERATAAYRRLFA